VFTVLEEAMMSDFFISLRLNKENNQAHKPKKNEAVSASKSVRSQSHLYT
jgi:hypothetical protein